MRCKMLQKYVQIQVKVARNENAETKSKSNVMPTARLAPDVGVCRCRCRCVSISVPVSSSVSPPVKSLRDVLVDHAELVIFSD